MVLIEEVTDGGWGRADETVTLAKLAERTAQIRQQKDAP
jgi:phenylpyruvate tautomerase PptA (4-oxalocrotonate tautomerase family)